MEQVNIAIAIAGVVVVLLGLASARLESLPVAKPLVALGVGIAVGPLLLGWLKPEEWPNQHMILKEAARFTLAISVFGIAIRTPREDYRLLLHPVCVLIVFGMLAMWAVSAGLAWTLLGVSPLLALLVGAIVTPTDPVVASSIVTGGLAERWLPDGLRSTLSLESGANDGLAYLIVLLPILLMQSAVPRSALGQWLVETFLVGVVLAVAIGAVLGYLAAVALHRADKSNWIEKHSLLSLSVALSLLVVAAAKLASSDGILAAFAAGVVFNLSVDRAEDFEEQNVQESISKLFNLPIFVLFGAMLPWHEWLDLGWRAPAFAAGVLLLRRPIALLIASRGLGAQLQREDAAFLAWFGPIGVAAIYYALLAQERTQDPLLWHVTSLVVVASILAHGVTSGPGLSAYRAAVTRHPAGKER